MLVDETDKVQARALAELKSNAIDLLDDDVDASAVVSRLAPLRPHVRALLPDRLQHLYRTQQPLLALCLSRPRRRLSSELHCVEYI